jgi:hypothetical protein
MTRLSDSKLVPSIILLDAPIAEEPEKGIIVFDLVLYHGQWSKNLKHGRCEHFITYRNYYVPKLANSLPEEQSKHHTVINQIASATGSLKKYDYPGHTTEEAILKEAQLLSGCFFSGHWERDNLSRGSLFYFHRLFCLRFNGEVPTPEPECLFPVIAETADSAPERRSESSRRRSESSSRNGEVTKSETSSKNKWLDGEVTYFDCRTASYFTVTLDKEEDVVNGVWNMGCLPVEGKLRRLPHLTKQIRSNIKFNKLFEKQDLFIDVKDGKFWFRVESFVFRLH